MSSPFSVALIGSFRQNFSAVLEGLEAFKSAGWAITSPTGSPVTKETEAADFVRFHSDSQQLSDPGVQTLALHRILRANVVYVVAPDGYVGRTTCYEIGRIIQTKRPLYFSERPVDLPIHIPPSFVISPDNLVKAITENGPVFFVEHVSGEEGDWERRLLSGDYLSD